MKKLKQPVWRQIVTALFESCKTGNCKPIKRKKDSGHDSTYPVDGKKCKSDFGGVRWRNSRTRHSY